jgi:hypothetical protein
MAVGKDTHESKNQPDPDTDTAAARRLADALDRDRVNDTPGLAVARRRARSAAAPDQHRPRATRPGNPGWCGPCSPGRRDVRSRCHARVQRSRGRTRPDAGSGAGDSPTDALLCLALTGGSDRWARTVLRLAAGWIADNAGRSGDPISELDPQLLDQGCRSRSKGSPGDPQDFSNPVITCGVRPFTCIGTWATSFAGRS